jgi:hypothetical protein
VKSVLAGKRAAACQLLLLGTLAFASSCDWFEAAAPRCVDAGLPQCTGSSCKALRAACEKRARICKRSITPDAGPDAECDLDLCTRDAAAKLAKAGDPDKATAKLLACTALASTCTALDSCFDPLEDPEECEEEARERGTDTQKVLPTRVPGSVGTGVAGLVVLPGDNLECLRCAFEPGSCGEASPGCFSANPASAGSTDSCLDYRVCLRGCEQTAGDDSLRDAQCVATTCDTPEHAQGKQQFTQYRSCMFDRCSDCFDRAR